MEILLVEPFFSSSHKTWAEGLVKNSSHSIELLTLPGRFWKWRMHGGAVTLANQFNKLLKLPDVILTTDMLDLTTFKSLCNFRGKNIPVAIYFHENQITYPWSPSDNDVKLNRNNQYGFINYTSALVADKVIFGSQYHKTSFLESLPKFLNQFPDFNNLETIDKIANKSVVIPVGMDLQNINSIVGPSNNKPPLVLWNHRWEYDKGPEAFFEVLTNDHIINLPFRLAILGQPYSNKPDCFDNIDPRLKSKIEYFGFVDSKEEYYSILNEASILPVTSIQDFFGISVVESIYCGAFPLLPNRLTYKEHIPFESHEHHIYNTNNEFIQMLQKIIRNPSRVNYKMFLRKYDWEECIIKYDRAFEEILEEVSI